MSDRVCSERTERLSPVGTQPAHLAARLGAVRAFARYASAADPRHEVPPEVCSPPSLAAQSLTSTVTTRSPT